MKITNLIIFTLTSVILSGLTATAIVSVFDKKEETARLFEQDRINVPDIYTAASISKGTILLLLAVGIIGALGVSRKRKTAPGIFENNDDDNLAEKVDSADHNQTSRIKKS